MSQRDLYAFITPEELASILEKVTQDRVPNLIGQARGRLEKLPGNFLCEFYKKEYWRFYLGFGDLAVESLRESPWHCGYIQFDNPIWSDTALREVHVVILNNHESTDEFRESTRVFDEIVKEIKKMSTRGKHLHLIWNNKIDKRNWLSEGARQWMREGKQVTDSVGTSDGDAPHVIHKLVSE